jgi:hypothetical protein
MTDTEQMGEQLRELAILVERRPLEMARIRWLWGHLAVDIGLLLHSVGSNHLSAAP